MKASAGLSLDSIVQFNWQVALGETVLSDEEIEMLARAKLPLVNLRGQGIVDLDTIKSVVAYWKKAGPGEATARDVVRMSLGMADGPGGLPYGQRVLRYPWMKDLLHKIEDRNRVEEIEVADGFEGITAALSIARIRMAGFSIDGDLARAWQMTWVWARPSRRWR